MQHPPQFGGMANGSSSLSSFTGSAATDLGFGGSTLADQVQGETDEERKKRLKLLQQQQSGVTATGSGSAFGGLAVPALFGNYSR